MGSVSGLLLDAVRESGTLIMESGRDNQLNFLSPPKLVI